MNNKLFLTVLTTALLGLNSWLIQHNLSSVSRPIEQLTEQVQKLNTQLTEMRIATGSRFVAVEKDVEDTQEDVAELKGRVLRLEDTM
ncbi:hypothetical protein [Desulfoluna spongiiphila]|uniref:hypothetical protein n=1 Tax=Desulfoluna spongiiphila TaxID=419481 RepID=UPI00125313A4|nr:hypothetical protein [Desulfoluna spongiiphila]VVS95343.1 hypothetical protein DBB_49200 [Desulfoluna spongiiphila]